MQTAPVIEWALTSSWSITPTAIATMVATASTPVASPVTPAMRCESATSRASARMLVTERIAINVRELERASPAVHKARTSVTDSSMSSTLSVQPPSPATDANTNVAATSARTLR